MIVSVDTAQEEDYIHESITQEETCNRHIGGNM